MTGSRWGLAAAVAALVLACSSPSAPYDPIAVGQVRDYAEEMLPPAERTLLELAAFVDSGEVDAPLLRMLAADLRRINARYREDSGPREESPHFPSYEEVADWTLVMSRPADDETWLVDGRTLAEAVWLLRRSTAAVAAALPDLLDGRVVREDLDRLLEDVADLADAIADLRALFDAGGAGRE